MKELEVALKLASSAVVKAFYLTVMEVTHRWILAIRRRNKTLLTKVL